MIEKEVCWNITARCNQNCRYCHRFLNISDLSYEDNYRILKNLKKAGINSITWTGGEALLINGIDDLLKKSYELGIKNKLITNGKLLTRKRIDNIINYMDSITLSIDSVNNTINDSLGRGKNHFQEIKEILDYIKEKSYSVKIRINSVVCKNNINYFEELITFLNNYNIYSWRVFKFMPLRELSIKNKELFDITMKQYDTLVNLIKDKSKVLNIDTRILEDMEEKYILILANGDIVITKNGKDEIVGNALKDSLRNYI